MKFPSLEHYEVDPPRLVLVGVWGAILTALVIGLTVRDGLGAITPWFILIAMSLAAYTIVSAPRRWLDTVRARQAKAAVSLSAVAAASVTVLGSKARVFLLLRSDEEELNRSLRQIKRRIMLGEGVEGVAKEVGDKLASYSAANVLEKVATLRSDASLETGEEVRGLDVSSVL